MSVLVGDYDPGQLRHTGTPPPPEVRDQVMQALGRRVGASPSVASKAIRYLAEGRLEVRRVDADRIDAVCRGAGGQYRLGWNPADRWWCECAHVRPRCSHLSALRLVTTRQVQP